MSFEKITECNKISLKRHNMSFIYNILNLILNVVKLILIKIRSLKNIDSKDSLFA